MCVGLEAKFGSVLYSKFTGTDYCRTGFIDFPLFSGKCLDGSVPVKTYKGLSPQFLKVLEAN